MMQTSQLSEALDGFRQALAVAQQNRQLREREAQLRELNSARIDEAQAQARKLNTPLDAAQALGGAISQSRTAGTPFDFATLDPTQFLNADPDTRAGLAPFLPDDASRAMNFLSQGKAIGKDDVFSLGDRDARVAGDRAHDIDKIFATPVSTGAGAVTTFGAGDPRGSQVFGRDTQSTANAKIVNDIAAGNPVDPVAAAIVLPKTGTINAQGLTEFGPTYGPLGTTQSGHLKEGLIAKEKFKGQIGTFKSVVANNPTSVGAVGKVRGAAQNALAIGDNFANAFGLTSLKDGLSSARAEIANELRHNNAALSADTLALFDPSVNEVQQLSLLIAYSAASALADQTGRGLSDKDIHHFRAIVGDATSWFATPEGITSKLDQLETMVDQQVRVERAALGLPPIETPAASPFDGAASGVPTAPTAPAGGVTRRLRYDASGALIEGAQ